MAISSNMTNYVANQFKMQSAQPTKKTEETAKLSENAQKYLEKLKEKYKNVDFKVSDFADDEEAGRKLKGGDNEFSCLISPDLLEKMASDEETAKKYEGIITDGTAQIGKLKEQVSALPNVADSVEKYGMSVDGEGNVSYYALLKDGLKGLNEKKTDAKTDKTADKDDKSVKGKDEKNGDAKKAESNSKLISANTIEGLLEKLKQYSEGKEITVSGGKNTDLLDFSYTSETEVSYSYSYSSNGNSQTASATYSEKTSERAEFWA